MEAQKLLIWLGYNATTRSVNLYAKWVPANYVITYNLNAGDASYNGVSPTSICTDGFFIEPKSEPTRPGYMFIEWCRTADGTGESMSSISFIYENTSVYAIWKQIIPNITVDVVCDAYGR